MLFNKNATNNNLQEAQMLRGMSKAIKTLPRRLRANQRYGNSARKRGKWKMHTSNDFPSIHAGTFRILFAVDFIKRTILLAVDNIKSTSTCCTLTIRSSYRLNQETRERLEGKPTITAAKQQLRPNRRLGFNRCRQPCDTTSTTTQTVSRHSESS